MARRSSNRIRNRQTVDLMRLEPDSRVLEIGCGPGLALAQCSETVSSGRIVGLDHSPVMLEQARKRVGSGQVELIVGGVDQLDQWSGEFDRIYSLNVIQFIADKQDFFRRVSSTLDAGGRCFTTYQPRLDNDHPDGADRMAEEIVRLMGEVGFTQIDRSRIDAGPTPAWCVYGTKPAG